MTWPAQSLDLNIIENVRQTHKPKLQPETEAIETRTDLIRAISRIWLTLSVTYIRSLYAPIP